MSAPGTPIKGPGGECVECGGVIPALAGSSAAYCSPECYRSSKTEKMRKAKLGAAMLMGTLRKPTASMCRDCHQVFVSAPGEVCETCWEENRFERSPVPGGPGAIADWWDTNPAAGRPSGSRRPKSYE